MFHICDNEQIDQLFIVCQVFAKFKNGKFGAQGCNFSDYFLAGTVDMRSGTTGLIINLHLDLPLDIATGQKTRFSWWSGRSGNRPVRHRVLIRQQVLLVTNPESTCTKIDGQRDRLIQFL